MFNWFPYTNFHNLNLDWILRKLKDIPTKVSQLENDAGYVTAASAGIITSVNGQTGDVVLDASDVNAVPAGEGLTPGGTAGQFLVKDSSDDFDASWATIGPADVGAVPAGEGLTPGGTAGQVLVKDSSDDFDASWATLSSGITFLTDGIWSILKFDNGEAVCFGVDNHTYASTTAMGSMYHPSTAATVNFPTGLFTDVPIVSAQVIGGGVTVGTQVTSISATAISIEPITATSIATLNANVHLIAYGKWTS